MKDKTPDQIRRETVPNKHYGFMFGFFGAIFGFVLWFGGWALLHVEQARRYPEYCAAALKAGAGGTLFGTRPSQRTATMTSAQLRYALLRYGNLDHHYDEEIIRHGWYPRQASPSAWVAHRRRRCRSAPPRRQRPRPARPFGRSSASPKNRRTRAGGSYAARRWAS